MENVITSKALWQDYDPAKEPLEVNVLKTAERGENTFKSVYFTGRTVADGKTRVFAKVCHKTGKKCKNAVLLVDNYKNAIDEEELAYWADNGFVAIEVDFAGRSTKGPSTIYPTSLDYCNADVAPGYFHMGEDARQTKIYEYAINCMRAITYLLQEEKASEISVVTIKKGVSVGIIVLGVDKRVTNGTVVFGSLFREYPTWEKYIGQTDLLDEDLLAQRVEYEEKRQMWLAAIAPQSYAMLSAAPIYLIVAANSPHVSSLNANKMFYRINDNCQMMMMPLSVDYMAPKFVKAIVNWCKGAQPESELSIEPVKTERGDNFMKLNSTLPLADVDIWYSRSPDSRARNWIKSDLKEVNGEYIAELDVYSPNSKIIAFGLAKGAVNITTPLCELEINNPSTVKTPTRSIFNGENGYLVPFSNIEGFHGAHYQVEYCEGYLGIRGAKSVGVATFALNDPCVRRKDVFSISFDICCDVVQPLHVYAISEFGFANKIFHQSVQLLGDGKWQRITMESTDFQSKETGKQMSDDTKVEMLYFVADKEFIINNIFML